MLGRRLTAWLAISVFILPMMAPPGATSDGIWWWPTELTWTETQMLTPSDVQDPPFHLGFGSQVAIDGDTLVVGTQFDKYMDRGPACQTIGHDDGCDWVYVFQRTEQGRWVETAKLIPDDAQPKDTFGYAVAVDDASGVIVVGNPGLNVQTNKVYIFERQEDETWAQTARINWTNPNERYGAFGTSVAVYGTTVAVPVGFPGHTIVFEKRNGTWQHADTLRGDASRLSISMGKNTIVTVIAGQRPGCPGPTTMTTSYGVYENVDGRWMQTAHIEPSVPFERGQTFGTRHAVNEAGDILAIGVAVDRRVYGVPTEVCAEVEGPEPVGGLGFHWQDGAAGAVGSVWVYERIDGEWRRTADIPNPTPNPGPAFGGNVFGASIDVSGDKILVGAYGDAYDGGAGTGAAFIYGKTADQWFLESRLRNHNSAPGNWFGYSVAIDNSTALVGADWSSYPGTAHIFEPMVDGLP